MQDCVVKLSLNLSKNLKRALKHAATDSDEQLTTYVRRVLQESVPQEIWNRLNSKTKKPNNRHENLEPETSKLQPDTE